MFAIAFFRDAELQLSNGTSHDKPPALVVFSELLCILKLSIGDVMMKQRAAVSDTGRMAVV